MICTYFPEKIEFPDGLVNEVRAVGSRVTCWPIPMDTDIDYLVLVMDGMANPLYTWLDQQGFVLGGSVPSPDDEQPDATEKFASFTKGDINLIITASPVFFRRFMAATSVARRLNLLDKADRIALFQAVLYGNRCL